MMKFHMHLWSVLSSRMYFLCRLGYLPMDFCVGLGAFDMVIRWRWYQEWRIGGIDTFNLSWVLQQRRTLPLSEYFLLSRCIRCIMFVCIGYISLFDEKTDLHVEKRGFYRKHGILLGNIWETSSTCVDLLYSTSYILHAVSMLNSSHASLGPSV